MISWAAIGLGIAKGAKFIFKHRDEIRSAVEFVSDLNTPDMPTIDGEVVSDQSTAASQAAETQFLRDAMVEITQNLDVMQTAYDQKITDISNTVSGLECQQQSNEQQFKGISDTVAALKTQQLANEKQLKIVTEEFGEVKKKQGAFESCVAELTEQLYHAKSQVQLHEKRIAYLDEQLTQAKNQLQENQKQALIRDRLLCFGVFFSIALTICLALML